MIRCPACGRRIPDAAPVCPTHGAPPPAPPPRGRRDRAVRRPAARPARVPGSKDPGSRGLRRRLPGRARLRRSGGRDQGRARGQPVGERGAAARGGRARRRWAPPTSPRCYARGPLDDGSAYVVMEFVRAPILGRPSGGARRAHGAGRVRAARARPSSRSIETAHGRGLVHCDLKPENVFVDPEFGAKLFDFGLVRKLEAGGRGRRVDQGRGARGHARVHVARAVRGAHRHRRPQRHLRARRDPLRDAGRARRPSGATRPRCSRVTAAAGRPRCRGACRVAVALEDAIMRCLAKDPERRFAERDRAAPGAAAAGLAAETARRRAATPPRRAADGGGRAGRAGSPGAGGKPAAPRARAPRRSRCCSSRAKSNVAAVREAGAGVGAQLAHTAGLQYVLAFGHEVGDNPTRAAANAGEMFLARGLAKRALVDLGVGVDPGATRRHAPLPEPAVRQEGAVSGRGRSGRGCCSRRRRSRCFPTVRRAGAEPARDVLLLQAGDAGGGADHHAHGRGAAGRPRRARCARCSSRRARRPAAADADHRHPARRRRGTARRTSRRCWCSTSRSSPAFRCCSSAPRRCWAASASRPRASSCARRCRCPTRRPPDFGRALLAERLGADLAREVWAGVAVTMGWAPPEHPELRALTAAPGALRSAAARAAGEALRGRLAQARAGAWSIEDAHFVDETALDALEYAALDGGGLPDLDLRRRAPALRARADRTGRAAPPRAASSRSPALEPAAAAELARRLLSPAENVPATRPRARWPSGPRASRCCWSSSCAGSSATASSARSDKGQSWSLATDELDRLARSAARAVAGQPRDRVAAAGSDWRTRGSRRCWAPSSAATRWRACCRSSSAAASPAETQLDAGIGIRRLVESGHPGAPPRRAGRVPPRPPARHRLPVGARRRSARRIHRAAYDYYRRQDRLPDGARLPQMAFHAARSGLKVGGRPPLSRPRAARSRARHAYLDAELLYKNALENLPGRRSTVADRRRAGARPGALPPRTSRGRAGRLRRRTRARPESQRQGGRAGRPPGRGDGAGSGARLAARRGCHRGGRGAGGRRSAAGDAGRQGAPADVPGTRFSARRQAGRRRRNLPAGHRGGRAARRRRLRRLHEQHVAALLRLRHAGEDGGGGVLLEPRAPCLRGARRHLRHLQYAGEPQCPLVPDGEVRIGCSTSSSAR